MKLLIIDDEELTREGLIHCIDWASPNISEVFQADDGINGLTIAVKERPDIILSDIRMPRMDGIKLAEHVKELIPDVNLIFMSGYSDREYLKAAIKLKAISYVEKPLNPPEVEEAILAAIESSEQLKRNKYSHSMVSLANAGKLALEMTYPPGRRREFTPEDYSDILCEIHPGMYFTTMILKSTLPIDDMPEDIQQQMHRDFDSFLAKYQLAEINVTKYNQFFIYHIFGDTAPGSKVLLRIAGHLKQQYKGTSSFFIAIGETVGTLELVHKSYTSAVTLLQSSFFYEYNSILAPVDKENQQAPVIVDFTKSYKEALDSGRMDRLVEQEDKIYQTFQYNMWLLPNQVKDIYYRLFMVIENTYKQQNISQPDTAGSSESILELVQNCHTLTELHDLLTDRSLSLFHAMQQEEPDNHLVFAIKEFISANYMNVTLSVKDISSHIHMNSSYTCTMFRNSTGITLNQYITEYRIEKAKQLLNDSSYKITDISTKVGYTDSNYFGKSFKKHVGLSPKEYREKMLL